MRVKLSEFAKMQGVSVRTLWCRINEGKLDVVKSDTGRVFVEIENNRNTKNVAIYARVSSSENKDNLKRQNR